jgi:hypothetical protein
LHLYLNKVDIRHFFPELSFHFDPLFAKKDTAMESKKNKDQKNTGSHEFGYEDLLDGFSMEEEEKSKNITGDEIPDMDDQALAELLGDEGKIPVIKESVESIEKIDSSQEENTDLEKEFEKLDLASISEELEVETVTDPTVTGEIQKLEIDGELVELEIKKPEFVIEEDQGGYASLLDQLENEEKPEEPAESKESEPEADLNEMELKELAGFDFEELSAKDEYNFNIESKTALNTQELPPLDDESAMMNTETDKDISVDTLEEPGKPEKEMDFLGLSGIKSKPDKSGKPMFFSTEVLFDGVDMDFDDQVDAVTHAELLLAQGKRKEAAETFHNLSKKKGVTHWVGKRIRMLSTPE